MAAYRILRLVARAYLVITISNAATYSRTDSIVGTEFLTTFVHQAIPDPNHGRTNYLSQADAQAKNLTFASNDTFIMRADSTTTLDPSGPGRDSIRIRSNAQFSTHVVIFDIRHMPEGCSTWPGVWEWNVKDDGHNTGEIDIIEGVNNVSPNQATLHTTDGCTMPENTNQTGSTVSTDCNVAVNGNQGCGVKADKANSFAGGFNGVGGGWYATERTGSEIKLWFWARDEGSVPNDVKNAPSSIDTSTWGTPYANFPSSTSCDFNTHFGPLNIIIDLKFCKFFPLNFALYTDRREDGDFAGPDFTPDGCGSDCVSFVNNNPSAFANAFWDIASLNIFQ